MREELCATVYILDPDTTTRRERPWHIYDGGDRFAVFALCSKVFDARPSGLTFEGVVVDRDAICGLCLAAQDRRRAPRDMAWQALYLVEHIPMDAISDAVVALEAMPAVDPVHLRTDPVAYDELARHEVVFLAERNGHDRLADRLAAAL